MTKKNQADNSEQSQDYGDAKPAISRLTRTLAAFTAGSCLVSSNMAFAAQPNDMTGAQRRAIRQADLANRREVRQQRHVLPPIQTSSGGIANPVITPGFIPHPDPNYQAPRNLNQAARQAIREARLAAKANRMSARSNSQTTSTTQSSQTQSTAAAGNSRADRVSHLVTQENNGQTVRLDNGANLDLTTDDRNITLGDKLFGDSGFVTITVGGESKNVYAGSKVTAAEYVAVKQALNGEQSIVVDGSGRATGGQVNLDVLAANHRTMKAESLTVAEGVTAVGDLDRVSTFKLTGDLTNYGSIYAVNSKGNSKQGASIEADNISNEAGALISSNAGDKFGNQASAIDLNLQANIAFSNHGTVESSGNLTVTAPTVTNSGTVASVHGDVTLDSPGVLNVDNTGGTIKAESGAINVRSADYKGNFDSTVSGGNLISKDVNLNSGEGLINLTANELTGRVNETGNAAHVSANTDQLVIGKVCLTGDPTFYNTGNILLDGDITVSEDLAILAEGNITSSANLNTITARDGAGNGQDIALVAGFNLTATPPAAPTSPTVGPFPGAPDVGTPITAGQSVALTTAGATGGNIDLTLSPFLGIVASGSGSGDSGGNVTLVARANGATGGQVLLAPQSTITTQGVGVGVNGNITVLAGSNANATTITLGNLLAGSGTGGGGNIVVRTVQAGIPGGGVSFNEFGVQSNPFTQPGANLANPGIAIGGGIFEIIDAFDGLTVGAGAQGVNINLGSTDMRVNGAGNMSVTSTGAVNISAGDIVTNGGNINFTTSINSAASSLNVTTFGSIQTGGGDLNITAPTSAISINTGIFNAPVISSGGGDITISAAGDISFTGPFTISTESTGTSGTVDLIADSNDNGAGNLFASKVNINTLAIFGGDGGAINLDSGDNVGVVLQIGNLLSFSVAPGSKGGNITFGTTAGEAGDITFGGILAGSGSLTIDADNNDHNVVSTDNGIQAGGGVSIDIDTATVSFTGPSPFVNITTDAYNVIASTVDATGKTVSITPFTDGVTIGINGGAGALNISATEFNQIIANTVDIGSIFSGAVNIGATDIAGTGAGNFDLFVSSMNDITGSTFNLGDHKLTLFSTTGTINIGAVTSAAGNMIFSAGNNLTTGTLTAASGDISASATNAVNIAGINATSGKVISNGDSITIGNVTGDTSTFSLSGFNDVTIGDTLLTGNLAKVTVFSQNGDITVGETIVSLGDIFFVSGGNITTTGDLVADPINMFSQGFISLGGSLTANNGIVVVAGKDIFSTASMSIDASDFVGSGGAVTIVAGAAFTIFGPTVMAIDGASGSGGSINLTGGGGLVTLTSEGNFDGGSVNLIAFTNGAAGGQVLLPTSSQSRTTGFGGASGDFNIVAGALSGNGIQTGSIATTTEFAGTPGSGNVNLVTSAPVGGSNSISLPDGKVSGGFFGGTLEGGSILTGNITARGAVVTALSGGNVGLGAVNVSAPFTGTNGGGIFVEATGTDVMDIGFGAGSNYITSVSANAGATGKGGFLLITNHGSTGMRVAPINLQVTEGAGGSINLDAEDGNIQLNGGTYNTSAAGAGNNGAGSITLNGSGVTVVGGNVVLQNTQTGNGAGGAVEITTSGAPNLNLGTASGQIQIVTSGFGDTIDLEIGGTINQTASGGLSADVLGFKTFLPGSDIILNGTNSANFIFIDSADALTVGAVNTAIAFDADAVGNITTIGAGLVDADAVLLTSLSGSIGNNQFARFNIDSPQLTANAFSGSVFINAANDVAIDTASTAANTFDLQASGAITQNTGGTIGANNVLLRSTGSTITLSQVVTGGTSVSLRAAGNLTNSVAGFVSAPTIALRSDTGTIGTSNALPFEIEADFVTATANGLAGSVFIHDSNSVDIGPGPSTATLIFDVQADGNITNSGTITAQDVVLNTGGSFNLLNLIIGNNSISLTSVGSITNGNFTGTLIAPQINLTTQGNIGSSALSRFNIDAGSVTLNAGGNVFLNDANQINIGPTASTAGGAFDILAGSDITINGTIGALSLTLRSVGGFIDVGNGITATAAASLRADGDLTTTGGLVSGAVVVLKSDNGNIGTSALSPFVIDATTVNANAPNGSVYIRDNSGVTVGGASNSAANTFDVSSNNQLNVLSSISADSIFLNSDTGAVILGAGLLNGDSLSISSALSITNATVGNATLEFDNILLLSTAGNIGQAGNALKINADSLTANASLGVFIDEADSVSLDGVNSAGIASDFELTAGADINVNGPVSSGATTTLDALGDIKLGDNVTGSTAVSINAAGAISIVNDVTIGQGNSVTLTSSGTITGSAGADLSLAGDDLVSVNRNIILDGNFSALALNVDGQISLKGVNTTGDVTMVAALGTVNAAGEISGSDVTITSETFTTQGDILASDEINITTSAINNTFVISAVNDLNISSFALGGLAIDGTGGVNGLLQSTTGNVNILADQDVSFFGTQSFEGDTVIGPGNGFAVVINNNAVVAGDDMVTLNTCTLLLNGNGTISGDPLVLNCPFGAGTIANSTGSVDLTGLNLVFNGQSLAIIASNNVLANGNTIIDLSAAGSDAGDLLVVAGFNFDPATVGQEDFTNKVFTLTTPNAQGGNIAFGGLNIVTDASVGDAGDVTLIARGGTVNGGSIVVDDISADGTLSGNGGDILIIAQGGFQIDSFSNSGATPGNTTMAAAIPVITGGPILVADGHQQGPGQFTVGPTTGNGTIANMEGDIDLTGLNLSFIGNNLAIIASGNIDAGDVTNISLANPGGNGGNLLVVAGFNFSPDTNDDQVDFDQTTLFTFGTESTTGGDIDFTGVNISTSGGAGNAGKITLVANGGGTNDGIINVGNLTANGTGGNGGDILVIGEGGVTVGNLSSTGTVAGTQTIAIAAPEITGGTITVQNGNQGGTGFFDFTVPTGAGTIANSQGDVTLAGNLTFVGLSLTIIALNDILAGPATSINLSNLGPANGGNLTLIAGYNFSPLTGGQVNDTSQTFTVGAPSTDGGDINFANVNIVTSGGIDAGSVVAVANGGAISKGAISLGNIEAKGGIGAGGDVQIIGESNIVVGDIDATGLTPGGAVYIGNAQPVVNAPYTIQNGNVLQGSFSAGTASLGTIATGGISAGTGIAVLANGGPGSTLVVEDYLAQGDINIRNNGSVTLNGDITSVGGSIEVNVDATTTGTRAGENGVTDLLLVNGATVKAFNNISLTNIGADRKNTARDQIILALNSTLETAFGPTPKTATDGQINITMGPNPQGQKQINNTSLPTSRFQVNPNGGELVLFGRKPRGVVPTGAGINVITLDAADLVINNFNNRSVEFQGSTFTHPDPPVAPGTPIYANGRLVGGSESANAGNVIDLNNVPNTAPATNNDRLDVNLVNNQFVIPSFDLNAISMQSVTSSATLNTVGSTLAGSIMGGDDNSFMVSNSGPSGAVEATICSDSELGVGTAHGIGRTAHGEKVVLKKGTTLFVPFQNTVVETPHGTVNINANSTVLVSLHDDKLAVYNLDDNRKGAVSVNTRGSKLTLAPGSHLTVANSHGEFGQINPIETISHRNVSSRTINGARVHTSEFSVASAIASVTPLQAVMNSKHPQAKKVANNLVKTTAILLHLNGGNDYQHYFKTAVTAMAK